jgi:hypothetical protein
LLHSREMCATVRSVQMASRAAAPSSRTRA